MDKRDLPFSVLAERHCFVDLLLVPYLLPWFLVISLFLPIALVGLGLFSLIWDRVRYQRRITGSQESVVLIFV